jgi:predicted dehydrogenase
VTRLTGVVVGVGALGRHHARILSSMDGVSLLAVADSNQTAGEAVAAACGTRWIADFREVLSEIDFAVAAVPTCAHKPVATTLLQAGVDVFVEKPIALNSVEAAHLVGLATEQNRILQVGHIERFNPAFEAALPRLADVKYLRAERISPYSFRSTDISVVLDMMIHDIDLLLAMTGEFPTRVEALGACLVGDQPDLVQARLVFPGGCVADLVANRVSPTTARVMQAWSSDGCTQIDFGTRQATCFSPTPTLLYGASPLERSRQPEANIDQLKASIFGQYIQQTELPVVPQDQLTAELHDFLHAVRTRQSPRVDGRQGLAALQVAEQISQSVESHAWDGDRSGRIGPMVLRPKTLPLRRAG